MPFLHSLNITKEHPLAAVCDHSHHPPSSPRCLSNCTPSLHTTLYAYLHLVSAESCWMRLPSGCNKALSETSTPTEWFIDPSNGAGATSCSASRLAAFNSYCGRSDAQNHWGAVPVESLVFDTSEQSASSPITQQVSLSAKFWSEEGPAYHNGNIAAATHWQYNMTRKVAVYTGTVPNYVTAVRYGCGEIMTNGYLGLFVCGCTEIWCPKGTGQYTHEYVPRLNSDGNPASGSPSGSCSTAKQLFGINHPQLGGWVQDANGHAKFKNTDGIHLWENLAF